MKNLRYVWPRGPMDKASDYESGDSRFESWRGRFIFLEDKTGGKNTGFNKRSNGYLKIITVSDQKIINKDDKKS